MRLSVKLVAVAVPALVLAASLAACGSSAPSVPSGGFTPSSTAVGQSAPVSTSTPVSAAIAPVPGSDSNSYVTGPFTVTMTGVGTLPSKFDSVTESGADIPEGGATLTVKDTSNSFTGWVAPTVEFVKGYSVKGQVLDTDAADPTAGSSGGSSDTLAPGQSETLYAQYQDSYSGHVEAQLVSVQYGTPGEGTCCGTTVQLQLP
jgi:hypothetical protein